jgi:hypothetical protein
MKFQSRKKPKTQKRQKNQMAALIDSAMSVVTFTTFSMVMTTRKRLMNLFLSAELQLCWTSRMRTLTPLILTD